MLLFLSAACKSSKLFNKCMNQYVSLSALCLSEQLFIWSVWWLIIWVSAMPSLKSFSFWIFSFISSQILPGRSFIGCNLTTKIFVLTSQWPVQFNKPLQASIEHASHHITLIFDITLLCSLIIWTLCFINTLPLSLTATFPNVGMHLTAGTALLITN